MKMQNKLAKSHASLMTLVLLLVGLSSGEVFANYAAAQKAFKQKNYNLAAGHFFRASNSSSVATKRKAEWGLAESLYNLEFYYSASKYYSRIVRRGASGSNPFFRKSLDRLGTVNSRLALGQGHVSRLFKKRTTDVPQSAQGFYYYYSGLESFQSSQTKSAFEYFKNVPSNSPYYPRAKFYQGVIANSAGNKAAATRYFEAVRKNAPRGVKGELVRELSDLNIARVRYEAKDYPEALAYYSQIPRDSDNWLESLFESSWAYFMMAKHNNVLGEIHTLQSPFFVDRFYPESYILQAITFLKLCKIKETKKSLVDFSKRYKPVMSSLRGLLERTRSKPRDLYKLVQSYRSGSLNKYREVWPILDSLSRTDYYKESKDSVRFSNREIARLKRKPQWRTSGLQKSLLSFLRKKKSLAAQASGKRLYGAARDSYEYLKELNNQTIRINTELLLKNLDRLRQELNIPVQVKKGDFIGGRKKLKVGQSLEYWPFEGEYWEDELGYYVYNLNSECRKTSRKRK